MSRVGTRDTKPEVAVRQALHRAGMRFRLHRKDLPGTPDIVLPKHGLAVFVHGCFWHRHAGCKKASFPKSREEFWSAKFERNIERDNANYADLAAAGWKVVVIWECEVRDTASVVRKVQELLVRST